MALADNIIKYRKKNGMTQEQLAESLMISRQSISRWELGENLPSIDNLISLSGLLDISLDELITGEPYLHFPFDFGRPKSKTAAVILIIIVMFPILAGFIGNIWMSLVVALILYMIVVWFYPFDFKRYYNYWSLEKKGIRYISDNQEVYSSWDNLVMPIKALLKMRKTKFIPYRQMKEIAIHLQLLGYNPRHTIYSPGTSQLMNEGFTLKITTKDEQIVYLTLKPYYTKKSKERQMLPTILEFLKRKNVKFIDKQNICELLKDNDKSLTEQLYEIRDGYK